MKSIVLFLALIPSDVFANPGHWSPNWKNISEIIVEGPYDDGRALIVIEGGISSSFIPPECRKGVNSTYNTTYLNTDKGRSIYSMALAAYMSGKTVRLALSCVGNRPLITHIRIK